MIFELVEHSFATFVVFCVLFGLTWLVMRTQRPPGIPPGPTPLPVVGNFLHMRGDMRNICRRLRERYGDVFSVFLGQRLVVVFNGYDTIKEAFVKNGDVFSDRPQNIFDFLPEHLKKSKGILNSSGDTWRKNRRFALSTLRDFGMGKNMLQTKIQEEARVLIKTIEGLEGEAFDMSTLIHNAVSNIICSIVFGKRFDYNDEKFKRCLKAVSDGFSGGGLQSMWIRFPVLRKLPGPRSQMETFIGNFNEITQFIKNSIIERIGAYDGNNIECVVDAYIKKEKLDTAQISSDDIYGLDLLRVIFDLFVAGTETTATTLLWIIMYFLNYPKIQDKVRAQVIDGVVEGRLPGIEDRARMPYLEATIMESLRHADIAPMSVTHSVHEDMKFRGYRIPEGTGAIVNIDSVMTDGSLWTNPEQFNPDRFLELDSVKKFEHFIPFSLGKRICLGESLARMELTIFLGALTRHFEFLPPEGEGPPAIEGKLGATFAPNHYLVRAVKRANV